MRSILISWQHCVKFLRAVPVQIARYAPYYRIFVFGVNIRVLILLLAYQLFRLTFDRAAKNTFAVTYGEPREENKIREECGKRKRNWSKEGEGKRQKEREKRNERKVRKEGEREGRQEREEMRK